jgi:imidazolonepropionase-like amidohydrolase
MERVSSWTVSPLLVLVFLFALPGESQDRRQFLDRSTSVSDDPRRVPVPPGPRGPEGTLVLRGGRVFDGTGAAPREMSLVIERNKITKLLPPGASEWPNKARVLDVSGKTVLPGLIDLHTHLTYTEPGIPIEQAASPGAAALRAVERLLYYIESGITSVRDTGSLGDVPFRLKEWVAQNRLPGPRVFPAGQLITGTGGHGAEGLGPTHVLYQAIREASGPADFREAVREQFKRGADFIKLASHFSRDEIRAAVEEAHALGIKVTVDAETFYIQWAVEAGADCIEHPLPRSDETIRLMAQKGTAAVPTLIPYIFIFDESGGYFDSTSRRFTFSKEANLEMLRRLKAAGIRMGVGTDLVMDWFRFLPQPYLTELKQFVAAGYTAAEALVAATRTNAEILDMADRLGTLEPGKLADVLVVGGRPDVNLDDLVRVELVLRDGYVVVEGGTLKIPRHAPKPPPSPRALNEPQPPC